MLTSKVTPARTLSRRSLPLTLVTKSSWSLSWRTSDCRPFSSMLISPPIPEIQLFQNLNMKIHGQSHTFGQSHIVGSATNWFTAFLFHINQPCHSWDTVIWKFYLENPRSRSWPRSKLMATIETLCSINKFIFHFAAIGSFCSKI